MRAGLGGLHRGCPGAAQLILHAGLRGVDRTSEPAPDPSYPNEHAAVAAAAGTLAYLFLDVGHKIGELVIERAKSDGAPDIG